MKVRGAYDSAEYEVDHWVSRELSGEDWGSGQIEALVRSDEKVRDAFGRLVAVLVRKNILTVADASEIVAGYDDAIVPVDVEN